MAERDGLETIIPEINPVQPGDRFVVGDTEPQPCPHPCHADDWYPECPVCGQEGP